MNSTPLGYLAQTAETRTTSMRDRPAGLVWMVAAASRRTRRAGAPRRGARSRAPGPRSAAGRPRRPPRRAGCDRSSAAARAGRRARPGSRSSACSAVSTSAGSTPSISRRNTSRAAVRSTTRIATVMSRPTIGSAAGQPRATPAAPTTTASEVSPSVRACSPSATSAAEPIRRPTRIRYSATSSLPAKPMTPAAATQPEVLDRRGVDQPVDGLPAGDDRGQRDHRDDEQPGQVLGPPVPVGVAAGRGPPGQRERDPQRHRGQRVGEVVDGVGQQRHRPADDDHQRAAAGR